MSDPDHDAATPMILALLTEAHALADAPLVLGIEPPAIDTLPEVSWPSGPATCTFRAWIAEDGAVSRIDAGTCDARLGETLDGLRAMRFAAPTMAGEPVRTTVAITLRPPAGPGASPVGEVTPWLPPAQTQVHPRYPVDAKTPGDVTCQARVHVTESGKHGTVAVADGCPHDFVEATSDAVGKWTWDAKTVGAPPFDVAITFVFLARDPLDPRHGLALIANQPAEVRSRVAPTYPAKLAGTGAVDCRVRVRVDESGVPQDVSFEACPDGFHEATEAAILKWRWYPEVRQGRRIESQQVLNIHYGG
jgi:hypothetical protein